MNPVHFTAGEGTEPEFVSVIPLSQMKRSSGLIGPSSVMAATGWQGIVGAQNHVNIDNDPRGTGAYTNIMDVNIIGVGGSPVGASLPVIVTGGSIGGTGALVAIRVDGGTGGTGGRTRRNQQPDKYTGRCHGGRTSSLLL